MRERAQSKTLNHPKAGGRHVFLRIPSFIILEMLPNEFFVVSSSITIKLLLLLLVLSMVADEWRCRFFFMQVRYYESKEVGVRGNLCLCVWEGAACVCVKVQTGRTNYCITIL